MAYINQPPDLRVIFGNIESRLEKLERAQRFTAPDVTSVPTYPRIGDIVFNNTADQMQYWDGIAWREIADNNLGTTRQTWNSTWSGTGLAYTGNPASGRYIRVGKMIFYTINVVCTNVTNFGTGQYSLTLPSGLNSAYSFQHIGGAHVGANHYTLLADLGASSNTITLYHPTANGAQDIFSYNKPATLTTSSTWYVSGTYFIA